MRAGFSPHAPYSCGPDVFAGAALLAGTVSTHIAETPEELELLATGTGPFRALLLDDVGLPEEALPIAGVHPIDLLLDPLAGALCVHLNCIEPRHAEALASVGAVACLCPRATAYFGRDVPGPFAMLREAGVQIVLGTDALLCLDTPDRICMLDEARLLFGLDAASALDLLAMITTYPADVLSVDRALVDLRSGPTAGILAVSGASLDDVFSGTEAPQWAAGPF
jgi:cytosine/adenosine deaminase-related metal-dependent hydrolase